MGGGGGGGKVVPLHKAGDKKDPKNYRTIMVASVYAKLFGKLLDLRLSEWCERNQVWAPTQADFRAGYSTLDHLLVLRARMEKAKRCKEPLFILFVDFHRAFDSVSRPQICDRLVELGVPTELVNVVAVLYDLVQIKPRLGAEEIQSTFGVIQGCPMSPKMFGLLIDQLFWLNQSLDSGNPNRHEVDTRVLLFADDVVMIGHGLDQFKQHLTTLATFCDHTGMEVNLSKTRPIVLYGSPLWGPTLSRSLWKEIERVQKTFIRQTLGIRVTVPYVLLMAEAGVIPLEVEALINTLEFVFRVRWQDEEKPSQRALRVSYHSGWYAHVCTWAAMWNLPECDWDEHTFLDRLRREVVRRLWAEPCSRQL
ncbi:hypothetical protein R1sor_024137 [Riccia sorocarpa]|uniref:Reverse transcriptase domain-containing protein n=1 Tax=Riccia sorocarpa TaxID=122646 RepID=A0ABD3GRG7_9MARC